MAATRATTQSPRRARPPAAAATPRPGGVGLVAALGENLVFSALLGRLRESRARFAVVQPLLPGEFVPVLVARPLYAERWTLLADGNASASKLRQLLPTLADALAAAEPRVNVLHRAGKEGLGKAYLAGFAWALARGYRLVLEMDADFSHNPRYLPRMLELAKDADLVLGSRNVKGGGTVNWGLGRKLLSRGGSFYARTLLGLRVRDLTGGFKCFRREVLEAIDLPSVECSGYAFQIELTYRAVRKGFRVVELPILFEDRRVGQSKMSRRIVLEAVTKVWSIRRSPFARSA
jgi:dolichol-phosphate mannosyltransferase